MELERVAGAAGAGPTAECPVCRMEVDPARAPASMEYEGETISFCSLRCRDSFRERPEFFLARRRGLPVSRVAQG